MARAPDQLATSVLERPVALCRRADLIVSQQGSGRQRQWVVKDALAWRFFHFSAEEYALLRMLDGRASLAEMQREFERQFAPQRLPIGHLQAFLTELQRSGLVVAERAGQGPLLAQRAGRKRREAWWQTLGNLLAIRFRGIDPDRLLAWLAPHVDWVFSRGFFFVWLAVVLGALGIVALEFGEISRRLPEFAAFFGGGNLPWLLGTLVVVKTLHELGHAIACKRFGGECHELGVQLLVFTPCLYCNVSDAWLLPNKWQRIAISAAGMYVELFLAAVATFLWRFSESGLLNSLSLNVMFVSSLATLLFNGNPLLRYDGYYILSDLIETPNLEARSQAALGRLLARWCLGVDWHAASRLPREREGWLAAFAAAAGVYRVVLLVTIYFYLRQVLEPLGLSIAADGLFLAAVLGLAVPAAANIARFVAEARMKRQLHRGRLLATLAGLALALSAVALVPLPHRVAAPLVLQPLGARHVYVTVPGTLTNAVREGEVVAAGETLATLINRQLERERAELESQRDQQRLHVEQLETQRGSASSNSDSIPAARQALADLEQRVEQLHEHAARLTLKAPSGGTVIPPPWRLAEASAAANQLTSWQGTPLDAVNRGSHLTAGTLFCLIGDPQQLEAVAILEQSQIEFIRPGQQVRLALDQWPRATLRGKVVEVARVELEEQPAQLLATARLASRTDPHGRPQPLETSYQVRISLNAHTAPLLPGAPGRCQISTTWQPLGHRLWRYLSRTFRFDTR